MPTIRRSVYIGLGGTGIKTIAHTKKMFEDVFGKGNIPPQIAFVAIDCDSSVARDPDLPTSIDEDIFNVPWDSSFRSSYAEGKAKGWYEWLFPQNEEYIPEGGLLLGTSGVRTTGRLFSELFFFDIVRTIDDAIDKVLSGRFDQEFDVYIALSMAGGTGSGTFIPVAWYIRKRYGESVNLNCYGVMPVGYCDDRGKANIYASVLDLDYMQSASENNPVVLCINGVKDVLKEPLLDTCYLADDNRVDVRELPKMIGAHMYLSGAELGRWARLFISEKNWKLGFFDCENKRAWVHGFSICKLVSGGNVSRNEDSIISAYSEWELEEKCGSLLTLKESIDQKFNHRVVSQYFVTNYKSDSRYKQYCDHCGDLYPIIRDGGCHVYSDTPGLKQQIYFYRQDIATIPYFLKALSDDTKVVYDNMLQQGGLNPHFDMKIYEEMKHGRFILAPDSVSE